jgi:hypothetical protein
LEIFSNNDLQCVQSCYSSCIEGVVTEIVETVENFEIVGAVEIVEIVGAFDESCKHVVCAKVAENQSFSVDKSSENAS